MGNKRKIKLVCDCGSIMTEGKAKFQHLETEAMICPKCSYTTLTRWQAEKYVRLIRLHKIVDADKKIIKIGNSMGIILPEGLKEMGVNIGKKVRIEALTGNSFKVRF